MINLIKSFVISFFFLYAISSCVQDSSPRLICACYVFAPKWETNYYIEIFNNKKIRTSYGLATDSIYHVIYENKDFEYKKSLFLSEQVFTHHQYDSISKKWLEHSGPTYKETIIPDCDYENLVTLLKKLSSYSPENQCSKDYKNNEIKYYTAGIVLMHDTRSYVFWNEKKSNIEYKVFELIKAISPIPIEPDLSVDGDESYCIERIKPQN